MAKFNKSLVASAVAVAFGVSVGLAQAGTKELVEKMYELGKINDAEYKELSEAAKPADNELIGKYKGGFKFATADGSSTFQVAGRVQMDYYDYNHDLEEDTFGMRRVYLGVKAKIDDIWKLEATYNPDSNTLEYGYLNFSKTKALNVRLGAQKFYSGFEEGTSSRFVDFLERSVADGLQPGKQIGVQVFGEPIKKTFFYSVGHYNGEGVNQDENGNTQDAKDSMFAVAYNAAGVLSGAKDVIAHVGYSGSSGSRAAARLVDGDSGRTVIFDLDGEARGDTFGEWNLTSGEDSFSRDHSNIALVLAKGPFKFHHETTNVDISSGAQNEGVEASFNAITWLITGEDYAKSYGMTGMKAIKPNSPVTKSGGTGAWEVGFRRSTWDAQEVANGNYRGADLVTTDTLGLKWIPNEKVRFMLNHVTTKYNTPIVAAVGNEKALIFRSQVDF